MRVKKLNLEESLANLKYIPDAIPDPLFKINAKKRIMNRITSLDNSPIFSPMTKPWCSLSNNIFRYAFMSFAAFILFGGGTVFAAQSSLPTEPLYPLKKTSEELLLNTAPLPSWKKDLSAIFLSRRIEEIKIFEGKYGEEVSADILESYEESLRQAKKYGNTSEELEKLESPKKKFEEEIINTSQEGSKPSIDKESPNIKKDKNQDVKGSTFQPSVPQAPKLQPKQESKYPKSTPKQDNNPKEVKQKQEEPKKKQDNKPQQFTLKQENSPKENKQKEEEAKKESPGQNPESKPSSSENFNPKSEKDNSSKKSKE